MRKAFLFIIGGISGALFLSFLLPMSINFMESECSNDGACGTPSGNAAGGRGTTVNLPESEWEKILTPEQFRILRDHGTERPFQNEYWDEKRPGIYVCAATKVPLFTSEDKFKSGTGWPSFTQPIAEGVVSEEVDSSYGMRRVESYCTDCGGHLGHVFEDGPQPTGLRYCMNYGAMNFIPADSPEEIPALVEKQKKVSEERIAELLKGAEA